MLHKCSRCYNFLDSSFFYKKCDTKYGLTTMCKSCVRNSRQLRIDKMSDCDKEQMKITQKKYDSRRIKKQRRLTNNKSTRKQVKKMTPSYICRLLKMSIFESDLNLIEAKKAQIMLYRKTKNNNGIVLNEK